MALNFEIMGWALCSVIVTHIVDVIVVTLMFPQIM